MTITLRADAQPSATPYKTLDRAQIELGFVHAVKNAGRKIGRRGKALGLMDLPALCGSLQNYFGHVRFDSRRCLVRRHLSSIASWYVPLVIPGPTNEMSDVARQFVAWIVSLFRDLRLANSSGAVCMLTKMASCLSRDQGRSLGTRSQSRLDQIRGAPDRDVEHGRQKQTETCDADHAEEHGRPKSLSHLGAWAGCDYERQDTKDEREGGHQDRPKPKASSLDHSLNGTHSALLRLFCEFDD
jgi:hypothetical protein